MTPSPQRDPLRDARVLLVGAGGLGCPAGLILARAGVGHISVLDDDTVELGNLHRQTVYTSADAGRAKAPLLVERLTQEASAAGHRLEAVAREKRLSPEGAVEAVRGFDLVLEGTDNFATKFLAADAAALAGTPIVQAGVVRFSGWALASVPRMNNKGACLRCVFEDIPRDRAETCAEAGVLGPVVGVVASLQAALALRILLGESSPGGELWSYTALAGSVRKSALPRRTECPLCARAITDTKRERYVSPSCAA
jgi:molybdopterin/thiamine biosynthesis adenylyltransferase